MSESYILPLASPTATVAVVGGKGAALARLAATDLPVPGGFHVTTSAYQAFIVANQLQPAITNCLQQIVAAEPETVAAASREIRELFVHGPIPAAIVEAITTAYEAMPGTDPAVAVRSSATAEDLPGYSFAGQQESYLNVRGSAGVVAAVRRCWASLWTARAISYRLRHGFDQEDLRLAVVVQELVAGEKAGILFTANPVNGRRDQLLLNAAWGLGETIVGGEVMPDQWVVDKTSGDIVSSEIAAKEVMTVLAGDDGTKVTAVSAQEQQTPTLTPADIHQLTDLARRIETFFGQPQDVEWVYQGGSFHIVQSRPVTSLFPLPEPLPPPDEGLRVYACLNLVFQGISEPLTPFGLEVFRLLYVGLASAAAGKQTTLYPTWAKTAAGRMYLDMTSLLRNPNRWEAVAGNVARKDPVAGAALLDVLGRNETAIAGGRGLKTPWRILLKIFPTMLRSAVGGYIRPRRARDKMLAVSDAYLAHLGQAAEMELQGIADRLRFIEREAGKGFWQAMNEVAYCSPGIRGPDYLTPLLTKWLGDDTLLHPVLQSLPDNPTTEMGLDLLRIARQMLEEGVKPSADHPAVRDFLRDYGQRAVQEIDAGVPRWYDEPEFVVQMIATYMTADPGAKIQEYEAAAATAEATIEQIVAQVRANKSGVHARLIGHLLRMTRTLAGLRERPKFDMIRAFALFRRVMVDVGQELVSQERLDDPEDVLFVTFAEIEAPGDLRSSAAANRALYVKELERTAVPRVMTSTGESLYGAPATAADGGLLGTPVSAGVYEGRARVVHRPEGAALQAGEVLITHSTDPGWTPLFLHAGALVMETGGPISHGAIVAREYGIPAVAGLAQATTRLQTGDLVRVDGEQGVILVLEEINGKS